MAATTRPTHRRSHCARAQRRARDVTMAAGEVECGIGVVCLNAVSRTVPDIASPSPTHDPGSLQGSTTTAAISQIGPLLPNLIVLLPALAHNAHA